MLLNEQPRGENWLWHVSIMLPSSEEKLKLILQKIILELKTVLIVTHLAVWVEYWNFMLISVNFLLVNLIWSSSGMVEPSSSLKACQCGRAVSRIAAQNLCWTAELLLCQKRMKTSGMLQITDTVVKCPTCPSAEAVLLTTDPEDILFIWWKTKLPL